MSTRATIVLKEKDYNDLYIYHHCDGGMWGVGIDLINRIDEHMKSNKFLYREDFANQLVKDEKDSTYEITACLHGDESHVYTLDFDACTLDLDGERSFCWNNPEEIAEARKWE